MGRWVQRPPLGGLPGSEFGGGPDGLEWAVGNEEQSSEVKEASLRPGDRKGERTGPFPMGHFVSCLASLATVITG